MALLADILVVLHLGLALYLILGEVLIVLGAWLDWSWIRSRLFRFSHLLLILIVAVQAVLGILCPLTTWEYALREASGHRGGRVPLMVRLVRKVLFHDLPEWVFTSTYVAFALLVVFSWHRWPPRPKAGNKSS